MENRDTTLCLSRRSVLGTLATGTATLALANPGKPALTTDGQARPRSTVRDHLWIFTVPAGSDDNYFSKGNFHGGSRMTPAEGAFYLNVPNLILVRNDDKPPLPSSERGWARTSFEQYATSFRPLDRVLWSVVGSGGQGGLGELEPVLRLARDFPNIAGIYLDDFIVDVRNRDGRQIGRPALEPRQLRAARDRIRSLGRPMEIWVTLYAHELQPRHPHFRGCDPPLASFLGQFDVLTLWTWWSDGLTTLDQSLQTLESVAPKSARIALGMYIWDFPNNQPVPMNRMKHQCERALAWIKAGRIHEIIVLGNTGLDLGLPTGEYVRDWIGRVGRAPI
jgi:hypothetical protein